MFINLQNKIQNKFNTNFELNIGETTLLRVRKEYEHKKTYFIEIAEDGYWIDKNKNTVHEDSEDAIDYIVSKMIASVVEYNHVSGKEKTLYKTIELKNTEKEVCEKEFNNFVNYLTELLNKFEEDFFENKEDYLLYENEFITCERG